MVSVDLSALGIKLWFEGARRSINNRPSLPSASRLESHREKVRDRGTRPKIQWNETDTLMVTANIIARQAVGILPSHHAQSKSSKERMMYVGAVSAFLLH